MHAVLLGALVFGAASHDTVLLVSGAVGLFVTLATELVVMHAEAIEARMRDRRRDDDE